MQAGRYAGIYTKTYCTPLSKLAQDVTHATPVAALSKKADGVNLNCVVHR